MSNVSASQAVKKKIAVFFGGPSPEHDVSVITGLQVLSAVDATRYEAFPVYISPAGHWYIGDALLRDRKNYLFDRQALKSLTQVTLDTNRPDGLSSAGRLLHVHKGLFQKPLAAEFDVAIPAFHGLYGEDGSFQGLMELADVPYVGMRALASQILMDKVQTKYVFQPLGIDMLPFTVIKRPKQGLIPDLDVIESAMKAAKIKFPCILKPVHLGSSIGVAKVTSLEEAAACLPAIFGMDNAVILEPFVQDLVEYNVAVRRDTDGEIALSAIERPKASDELLDFKQKYQSGGGGKMGSKSGEAPSEGMLSLTRELNPSVPAGMEDKITSWAKIMFDGIGGTGAPRIDFIADAKKGQIWLNEVNPFPGSAGYFLWEAAPNDPLLFAELLSALITEAEQLHMAARLPRDPVPKDARLLKRSLSE